MVVVCGACGSGRSGTPWEAVFLDSAVEYRLFAEALTRRLIGARVQVRAIPGRTFSVKSAGAGVFLAPDVDAVVKWAARRYAGAPLGVELSEDSGRGDWVDLSPLLARRQDRVELLAAIVAGAMTGVGPLRVHCVRNGTELSLTIGDGTVRKSSPDEVGVAMITTDIAETLKALGWSTGPPEYEEIASRNSHGIG